MHNYFRVLILTKDRGTTVKEGYAASSHAEKRLMELIEEKALKGRGLMFNFGAIVDGLMHRRYLGVQFCIDDRADLKTVNDLFEEAGLSDKITGWYMLTPFHEWVKI